MAPVDLDDLFGSWVPGGDGEDDEDPSEMPEVVIDTAALGKRKRYISSVHFFLMKTKTASDTFGLNRTSLCWCGEKAMCIYRSSQMR